MAVLEERRLSGSEIPMPRTRAGIAEHPAPALDGAKITPTMWEVNAYDPRVG